MDGLGHLTDNEYWKLRRGNLCHLANVGFAYFLTSLMSKDIQIAHDGSVAARVGICHQDVNWPGGDQQLQLLGLSTSIGANHKWCVVDLWNGTRVQVDLAATQYDMFTYDRGYRWLPFCH